MSTIRYKTALVFMLTLLLSNSLFSNVLHTYSASFDVGCVSNPAARAAELIARIDAANSSVSDDEINLTANCTYTLTEVNNTNDGENGLPSILSTTTSGELVIHGNGATIERSTNRNVPNFRIVHVAHGAELTLDHVTLRQGYDSTVGGGGIYNNGSVTIIGSSIINNTVLTLSSGGASSVSFVGGGGIHNRNSLTVIDSTVSNNTAQGANEADDSIGVGGGGIWNWGATQLTIINTSLSGNSAATGAGIYYAQGGPMNIVDSTLDNNTAESIGGGLVVWVSVATITNSTIINNVALRYGGIYHYAGELTVTSSTISSNTAQNGHGGGVANDGTMAIIDSTISGNRSTGNDSVMVIPMGGGGIYNHDELNISGSTIMDNVAVVGGGIFNDENGELTMTNSTISNNEASGASAIYNVAMLTLSNTTISSNVEQESIGAITIDNGVLNIANTVVANTYTFAGAGSDCVIRGGRINASGANLVEDGSCNIPGALSGDPMLGLLQNNGGNTMTHALLPGSIAINTGENEVLPADSHDCDADSSETEALSCDQRGPGFPRVNGSVVDLGAFEALAEN